MKGRIRRIIPALFLSLAASGFSETAPTDIIVGGRTVVQRCVIDGPSARMVAVGFPDGFNYAFDAQNGAPVYIWRGGFIDFAGETLGRGGRKCDILGVKQTLGTAINPIRINNPDTLPEFLAFKGYRRDPNNGTPAFRITVDGVSVEQSVAPLGPDVVQISLEFDPPDSGDKFYHLDSSQHEQVTLSEGLSWHRPGIVAIPSRINKATLTLNLKPVSEPFVRKPKQLSATQLYSYYCKACHSTDGTKLIGPSFKGLWGRTQELIRNGETDTLTVDAYYIRESITHPQAAIVQGYEAVPMPSFESILSDRDIDALIEFFQAP